MLISSTLTFSMGSGERKRCSNMAPVRRLRSLAWMKARRFPGVRCSTLKTECSSPLCLMTMPGRICVAGIDIASNSPWGDRSLTGRGNAYPADGARQTSDFSIFGRKPESSGEAKGLLLGALRRHLRADHGHEV